MRKYTFITVWTQNTALFSLVRCDNETYERQIVASFDELSAEENRDYANKCSAILNEAEK